MAKPSLHWTSRARNRLSLYRVTDADVRAALDSGHILDAGSGGQRRYAWHQHGDRWLRVLFSEEARRLKIISLTLEEHGPPPV